MSLPVSSHVNFHSDETRDNGAVVMHITPLPDSQPRLSTTSVDLATTPTATSTTTTTAATTTTTILRPKKSKSKGSRLQRTASELADVQETQELERAFAYLSKGTLYIDCATFLTALHRTDIKLNGSGTPPDVAEEFLKMIGDGNEKVDFAAFKRSQRDTPIMKKFTQKLLPMINQLIEESKREKQERGLRLMFNALKGAPERETIDPVAFSSVLRQMRFMWDEEREDVITNGQCHKLLRDISPGKNGQVHFADFQSAVSTNSTIRRLIACLAPQQQREVCLHASEEKHQMPKAHVIEPSEKKQRVEAFPEEKEQVVEAAKQQVVAEAMETQQVVEALPEEKQVVEAAKQQVEALPEEKQPVVEAAKQQVAEATQQPVAEATQQPVAETEEKRQLVEAPSEEKQLVAEEKQVTEAQKHQVAEAEEKQQLVVEQVVGVEVPLPLEEKQQVVGTSKVTNEKCDTNLKEDVKIEVKIHVTEASSTSTAERLATNLQIVESASSGLVTDFQPKLNTPPSRQDLYIDVSDEKLGLVSEKEKPEQRSFWWWCCCRKKVKSR